MRLAILGGSFNPIHIGHLSLADEVRVELGYDKILFVPASVPPHKIMNDAVGGNDRLEMIRLACENNSSFCPESCELDRGGISYTYDTICFLEKKFEDELEGKIGIIMGQELAAEFYKWYKSSELSARADIIVARRHIVPDKSSAAAFRNTAEGPYTGGDTSDETLQDLSYPHKVLQNPLLPISSTEIRCRISEQGSWRYLVPQPVYHYIIQRNLYGYKRHFAE